jgi:ABC-type branched-subunit amino acid transport system substrate-binding protein
MENFLGNLNKRSVRLLGGIGALCLGAAFSTQVLAQTPLALKICEVDDRSGSAADTGTESLNGLMMAIGAVNANGGINGRKIELTAYDGKTDPQLTATFATRCAEDDKALMILGGNPGATAAAMVPVAEQFAIPLYIMSASPNNLTDNAIWQFRFGPMNAQDAIAVADAFAEIGFKKAAIINNSTPFGTDGARSVSKALEGKGIAVVTVQTYDMAATDVSPQVINAREANPDVILIYPYPADGARVMRTIRQLGLKAPVMMPRVGLISAFRKLAGEAADGVLVPTSVDISRPEVAKFFTEYNAKFRPIAPSPYAVQGYDSATLAIKSPFGRSGTEGN